MPSEKRPRTRSSGNTSPPAPEPIAVEPAPLPEVPPEEAVAEEPAAPVVEPGEREAADVRVEAPLAVPEEPEVLAAPVADEVVDEVVAQINEATRLAALEMALKVGRIVMDHFYQGDTDLWRNRGTKDASFRKLADRADLQMSASGLHRCVAVYDLSCRVGVSTLKHLDVSHIYAVLGLETDVQRRLLEQAGEHGWSVQQVLDEARAVRREAKGNRGRPPLPAFVKTITRMRRLLDPEAGAFEDLDQVDAITAEDASALYDTVSRMRERCEAMEARLRERLVVPS